MKFNSFSDAIEHWSKEFPNKTYIHDVLTDESLTFKEFNEKVNSCCRLLEKNKVKKGDIVSICLKNSCEFVVIYFSILRIGATLNPNPVSLTETELIQNANFLKPKLIFVQQEYPELSKENDTYTVDFSTFMKDLDEFSNEKFSSDLEGDDTCCMYYTSGTTSNPKAMMYSRKGMIKLIESTCKTWGHDEKSVHFGMLPMGHGTSILNYSILPMAYVGGTVYFAENFIKVRPKVWGIIKKYKVDYMQTVPTIITFLLNTPYPDYSKDDLKLKYVGCGSAPLTISTQVKFQKKFGLPVSNLYGTSETGQLTYDDPLEKDWHPGSVGFLLDIHKAKIIDDENNEVPFGETGEIVIKGDNPFKGYYKNETATKEAFEDGWFRTGDYGYMEKNGRMFYEERKKDIIIKGGSNLSPSSIDEVVLSHPDVIESCSVGVPDEILGEDIITFVVLKEKGNEKDVMNFCAKNLPNASIPKKIIKVKKIPQTASGKQVRRKLKLLYMRIYQS